MLQLLLERGVVAHGSAALDAARHGNRSRRREQRLGQAGLAAPRLPDERYRPDAFYGMCHGSSSSRKSFPRCPPIFNRYLGTGRGVDTASKISRRNNSGQAPRPLLPAGALLLEELGAGLESVLELRLRHQENVARQQLVARLFR